REGENTGAREAPRSTRQGSAERRELSGHLRASFAAQAGVRRSVETREQGDRSHAKAACAQRAHGSRGAVLSPCAVRRSFLLDLQLATRRAKACARYRAGGGVHGFLPPGSAASRRQRKMRRRHATPATDPSSKL